MRLPDFIVAGAVKSGTTSLNYQLKQHPDIYMSPFKEPRYFAFDPTDPGHTGENGLNFPITTLEAYADLFAEAPPGAVVGEVSPHYMISPVAPRKIKETTPDVKLIFSLRDPVKRAYSVYWHAVRLGQEPRPPEDAFTDADYRVRNGRYFELLQPWYALFPASQITVILFDDLVADPVGTFQKLCRVIGVDDTFVPDTTVRNQGGAYKNKRLGLLMERVKMNPATQQIIPFLPGGVRERLAGVRGNNFEAPPPMPDSVHDYLNNYFAADIEQLEQLLGRNLDAWRN